MMTLENASGEVIYTEGRYTDYCESRCPHYDEDLDGSVYCDRYEQDIQQDMRCDDCITEFGREK